MKKSTVIHRLLSLALCLCMVLSLMPDIPLVAQAAGTEGMITIEMTDSYEDGWNGNAIEIYADDVLLDTVTLKSGASGVWTTLLDAHAVYTFTWIRGSYPEEASFVIYKGTEEILSAKGDTYDSNSVIFELAKDCAGTEYNDSFCCAGCGKACEHKRWKESVCDVCGFVCGSSLPHIWEGDVCARCSVVCTHEGYVDGPCAVCGGICGVDYLHSFTDGKCSVCKVVCGADIAHAWKQGVCEICGEVCSHPETINGFCDICQYYEAPVDDDGDGYYDIDNAGKLYWFSDRVASGDQEIKGELTQDIRINHQVLDVNGNPPTDGTGLRNWVPIGSYDFGFRGNFEGNHHTISGLYYHGNHMYAGLFGQVQSGIIRNVRLADSYLCATLVGYHLGGIAGSATNTTLSNCHNEAVLEGRGDAGGIVAGADNRTKITNCTNSGSVTGDASTGGILGRGGSTITYCGNTGNITSAGSYYGLGGISGYDGTFSYCYNTGTITCLRSNMVGGICGITTGDISYCYSTGKISIMAGSTTAGRILGDCNTSSMTVQGCYYLLDNSIIPVVGDPNENVIDNVQVTAEQFASGEACWLMNGSGSSNIWKQSLGIEASPRLTGESVYRVSVNLCTGEEAEIYSNSSTNYALVHKDENKDHVCDDCGENASDCDDRNNDHNCDICGTALTAHKGEANCVAAAICNICGKRFGTIDENNHSFSESGLCIRCGVRATASVVNPSTDSVEYFMTLEEAIAYAANIDQSTIRIHSDVQIDGEVSVGTLEILEGATVTVNGTLSANGLSAEGNWAGEGYVNIDVNKYKVYNNKLYLLGGAAGVDWEIWNVTEPTYWTAGDGYAAFDPETGVLNLHNATIYAKAYSSDDAAVVYQNDLTINFSGTNTLTTNDHNSGTMLGCMGETVMNGIGEDAVLNIYSGYRSNDNVTGEVRAAVFDDLTVNSGTLNVISGNGVTSIAIDSQSVTVAEGAVVNAIAGNANSGFTIGLMTYALTVDGTLNAASGSCGTAMEASISSDILVIDAATTGSGTINGLCIEVVDNMRMIDYIVCGNTNLNNDRTLQPMSSSPSSFIVPEGSTLTIAEGVTLDLSLVKEIDFYGTVVNNGRILLPASYDLNNAPKSGTVLIGENSFTWYEDGWYCSSESQHTGGMATCANCAVCQLCGKEYGDKDYDNHTGDPYAEYEWYPGEDNTCYAYATLYCSGCDSYLDSASGDCELVENVEATDCLNPGHVTYRYTCTMGKVEYTETHTIIISSENHVGQFENGFCSACDGYEKPEVDPGEDAEWDYDDVYLICNAGQLYWFADYVNNVNNGIAGKLMANIDLNPGYTFHADGTYTGGDSPRMWTPIGEGYPCYAGHFDGNDFTVSGAYAVSEGSYVGLFGNTDYNYTIENLGITNSYFKGADHVGGLIGYAYTTVKNCYVTDTVYVSGSHTTAALVGYNGGEIYNSYTMAGTLADGGSGSFYNCYYLADEDTDGYDGTTALTADQFASGGAAYLLQSGIQSEDVYDEEGNYVETVIPQIWGQTLGTDSYPILGGMEIYRVTNCKDEIAYSNTEESGAHIKQIVTGKAPTCTESGLTDGVICSVCGETLTAQEGISATGNHVDADNSGRCDTCNGLMQPAVLRKVSASLKGNIALNYYMLLSDEVLSDETAYMQFTMADGEIIKIPVSQGVKYELDGESYCVFTCAVDAKEMTDTVLSQFFYGGGVTKEHSYSVQTYAKHILTSYDDAAVRDLITAMLNYGAASQLHFGYNTDRLANAELTAPDYTGVTIQGFDAVNGQGTEQAKLCSASLLLKSETTLRFFFTAPITAAYNGQELEVKQRGSLYYVDVAGIAAKDLDENVTITIHDGTNTAEVSFNPISYCQGVRNDTTGTFDQEMKDLVSALYLYNQAANAYFTEG